MQELQPPEQNHFFAPPAEEAVYTAGVDEVDLEGKIINEISFEGLKTISPEAIKSQIKTIAGSLFNEELLQQDLQRIYAVGFFTDKMAIEPELNDDGTVNLKFILQENIKVTGVSVVGNTVISTMELLPFVTPLRNYPQNIANINEAIDKINNYYHTKGYILAGVNSVDDSDDGNLVFSITEGVIDKIFIEVN